AGVSASKTDIADGQSATLTFTGPGSMTVTAVSNGVAAESYLRSWGASTAVMAAPSVLTPIAGTIALQPVITASTYSVSPAGYDTHTHSQCQVRATDGSVLWDSGEVSATTEFAVSSALPAETDVDIVVRYKGSRLGWGNWSALARRTTQAAGGAGVVYPDGGIGGPVVGGYRLIVASAAQRGQSVRHGLYGTDTSLTNITNSSTPDPQSGYDNTNTLINGYSGVNDGQGSTGPAAAQHCRDLGSDWYLPNKDELAAIVAMADEIDAADSSTGLSFADIGNSYIWSSSEYNSLGSWVVRASGGSIYGYNRSDVYAVVPVRRVSL
ncbi:MAG: DUF1566 domain-containing protein, partial [Marinobacterium sp.]|nr:DUF1566 domain-containing protein [Marinobacterium sp.]